MLASLLPNFLEDVGSFSQAQIGVLFSVSFLGAFMGNNLIAHVQPRTGFLLLLVGSWVGMVFLLASIRPFLAVIAFFLFGGLTTMWLIKAACSSRAVSEEQQGIAFGLIESLGFLATSAAAGIAGVLYSLTPTHTLPTPAPTDLPPTPTAPPPPSPTPPGSGPGLRDWEAGSRNRKPVSGCRQSRRWS